MSPIDGIDKQGPPLQSSKLHGLILSLYALISCYSVSHNELCSLYPFSVQDREIESYRIQIALCG